MRTCLIPLLAATLAFFTGCASTQSPTTHDTRPGVARMAGVDVAYTDSDPGSGRDAVVLVHGWSSDSTVWEEQIEPLAHDFRVIAIDLPGHGNSGKPDIPYTMDFQAEAVAAVMTHAGANRGVMVGHSNGTPVVRQFYRRHPGRTLALIAVDGTLLSIIPEGMLDTVLTSLQSPEYLSMVKSLFRPMLSPDLTDEQVNRLFRMVERTPQHVMISTLRAANEPDIWVKDPIDAPLQLILAEGFNWTPDYLREVRTQWPHADIHLLRGVTHMLFLDDPHAFRALLRGFISTNDLL